MTKHMVADLGGVLLDAAVAKAEGHEYSREQRWGCDTVTLRDGGHFRPSESWAHGGPIIARECISLTYAASRASLKLAELTGSPEICWGATVGHLSAVSSGPAPLIAAMRAFVACKFGEEVEL